MKTFAPAAALLLLAACSYPQVQASAVDTRPHLSIANAPAGAILTIDGTTIGPAADYAPSVKQLALDHGTHLIVISSGGTTLFSNSVYLGDGTSRTITLPN
jgi:hypothetical protein